MSLTEHQARQWAKSHASHFVGIDDLAKAYLSGYEQGEFDALHPRDAKFPSASQLERIREMYVEQRCSVKELAAHFHKKPRQITYILDKYGLRKRVKWDVKKIRFVRKHYKKDKTLSELARHFGTSEASIKSMYYSNK